MKRFLFCLPVAMLASPAISDERSVAFACMEKAAATYALASCERVATILVAAKGACGKEIEGMTSSVVNDPKYQSLSLEWRLSHRDRLLSAREGAMTAIVLEARVRAGKNCD